MKIYVNEKDKNFFDECLYIQFFIKNVLKKPNKKVWYASKTYLRALIIYILYSLLFVVIGFNDGFETLTVIFIVVFVWFSVVMLYNCNVVRKQINLYMSEENGTSVFEINDDVIRLNNSKGTVEVKWDLVKYILINRESISFVPGDISTTNVVMFISTKYKEQVVDAIIKYKKEDLIIDNSKLYK